MTTDSKEDTRHTQQRSSVNAALEVPPRSIPVSDEYTVDNAYLNEHNERATSSSSTPTLHRASITRSTIRYSKRESDEDLEERHKVMVTPLRNGRGRTMSAGRRFFTRMKDYLLGSSRASHIGDERGDNSSKHEVQMYHVHTTNSNSVGYCKAFSSFLCSIVNCGAIRESSSSMNDRQNPNIWITNIFYWLFRKGWRTLIVISLINFYVLVLFFTALIVIWTTYMDHDCVVVGGLLPIGTLPKRSIWMDAFSLSWNTFSTVGYGSTYPSLSTEHDHQDDKSCSFISFLTSFEAFVGVIYAGFTGGIIFAKVTRITQRAKIRFSDPLLVRWGSGVNGNILSDDINNENTIRNEIQQSPFPVLEFRLVNELHNVAASEIIGSHVNAVVLIEAQQDGEEVSDELVEQIKIERLKRISKAKRKNNVMATHRLSSVSEFSSHSNLSNTSTEDNTSTRSTASATSYVLDKTKRYFGNKKMKIDEEEVGGVIVPRLMFCKLSLDHSEHPFLKRLWTFRHVINGESPLLSNTAKQRILENGGQWPNAWNNAQAVRDAIRFNQIMVSFTGVSNISAADVYKQKVYDYVDLVCGYQFVNPMYTSSTGRLKVDLKLINDVVEQNGGGGEQFLNVIIE